MVITKFNNRKNSVKCKKKNQLSYALAYICDPNKTRKNLIGGIGVDSHNSFERMQTTKRFYGKEGGRDYIHFCVSFPEKQDESAVFEVAEKIASYFSEYQVLYAVHLNTANTHIHFILNSVSIMSGKKFSQSRFEMKEFKDYVDHIVNSSPIVLHSLERYQITQDTYYDMDFYDNDYGFEYESDCTLIQTNTSDSDYNDFDIAEDEQDIQLFEPMEFDFPHGKVLPSIIIPYFSKKEIQN